MNRRTWFGVVAAVAGMLVGCSSGSAGMSGVDGGAFGQASSGGSVAKPSCYLAKLGGYCECVAKNEDDARSADQWTKVSACNESTSDTPLTCTADTKVDGTTTSCSCVPFRCTTGSGSCRCGAGINGEEVASCRGFEWYCARVDRTSCYGGNGTYGSACGNDEENVPSCSMAILEREEDNLSSCDGLKFVAPPPPPPSTGGSSSSGCSGCSSDSDCHDKCLRCDRSTCSCVRRLSC